MDTLPPEQVAASASATSGDDRASGAVVAGRYRLIEQIGDGAMGKVYLAEHEALRRQVAVKFLHDSLAGNAEVAARFAREAVAAARLEHPNVVAVFDSGTDERGRCFMVMEYVRGELLRDALDREGALPRERALDLARQMAAALDHAHALGIVHRDIKPENVILLRRDDGGLAVKVIDFGIAKVYQPSGPSGEALTRTGIVLGTPEYMAPEQALGADVDHRADLYALAVTAYEMLVGRRPFDDEDVMAVLMKHLHATAPPPSAVRPEANIPPAVDAVFATALAKSAGERFRSAGEFVEELERAFRAPPGQRSPTVPVPADDDASLRARLLGLVASARERARPELERASGWWRSLPRRTQAAVVAGAGVLVAVASLAGLAARAHPPEPSAPTPVSAHARPGSPPAAPARATHTALRDRIEALRARPDLATGTARERQQAAATLEALRTRNPDDAAVAYVLGALYARDRATGPLSLAAYRDALLEAPELASDATLVDDVVRLYATHAALAVPAEALLQGPLARAALEPLVELAARGGAAGARAAALLGSRPFEGRLDATERGLVALATARTCDAKRAAVALLAREGDARALPALRRIPTGTGCGFLGLATCNPCLAPVAPAAVRAIEARAGDAG